MHTGISTEALDNIILGQLPKRIIIGFVNNTVLNGNYASNPFIFQFFGVKYLQVFVDGVKVPDRPLHPRFDETNPLIVDSLHTIFPGCGIHYLDQGNCTDTYNYGGSYFLTAFDFTPDGSSHCASHWNLVRSGNVRLEVRFKSALARTVNSITFYLRRVR